MSAAPQQTASATSPAATWVARPTQSKDVTSRLAPLESVLNSVLDPGKLHKTAIRVASDGAAGDKSPHVSLQASKTAEQGSTKIPKAAATSSITSRDTEGQTEANTISLKMSSDSSSIRPLKTMSASGADTVVPFADGTSSSQHTSPGPGAIGMTSISASNAFGSTAKPHNLATSSDSAGGPANVRLNDKGQYIVDGQTLAPGSSIVLNGEAAPLTLAMLTSSSQTYIAIGTMRTITLTAPTSAAALAFTQASDGNLVIHGTTLVPGHPITLGTGSSRTTLRLTSMDNGPAIVLNGNTTEVLSHLRPQGRTTSSSVHISLDSTPLSMAPMPSHPVVPTSSAGGASSVSGSCPRRHGAGVMVSVIVALLCAVVVGG